MTTIIKNRTIRPSSRLETSKSYKIDTKAVDSGDTLIVNIDQESKHFNKSFSFDGRDVNELNSISFRVNDYGSQIGNIQGINLIVLPSSSPANAGFLWDAKIMEWNNLNPFIHGL